MLTRTEGKQLRFHMITIEDLVPEDHFLRKLERHIDFSFIYHDIAGCYSEKTGRPSIDPIILIKYLLIGFLYGIESERRLEQEIRVNVAYRWFLGLDLDDTVPDHSTISQNRRRRFRESGLFRRLFEQVLLQCMNKGLITGHTILTDSTHIKANASSRKNIKVMVEKEAGSYLERLDAYEEQERSRLEEMGMIKPQRKRRRPEGKVMVEKTVSTTDPDAGMMHRPGKPEGMHYLSHQSIDAANGMIVDVAVTPGDVSDSVPYLERIDYMRNHLGLDIRIAGADSAYGTSLICQTMEDMGVTFYTPGVSGGTTSKVELTREAFDYDAETERFICPTGKGLPLRSLERGNFNVCRVYRAAPKDCISCQIASQCVSSSHRSRTIRVNIFEKAVQRHRQTEGTPAHTHILNLRQIWCEGSFAAQKARHNLRKLYRRGLEAAEDHCLLSATAFNLKRMIKCLE